MKIATISQTKNNFSAMIDQVRNGETILIMDRNRPVARLEPVIASGGKDPEGRIERLERAGVLRRGSGTLVREILRKPPPKALKGGDILAALLDERERGR
jgi:prevent-host-death family protein